MRGPRASSQHSEATLPVVLKNLPIDAPAISEHPPRNGIVEEEVTLTTGSGTMTVPGVTSKIRDNLWGVTGNFNFQILKIVVWGTTLGSEKVTITDILSGIKSSDLGSAALRAKVGLHFPPIVTASRIYSSTDAATNLYDLTSGAVAQSLDTRVSVRVWAQS